MSSKPRRSSRRDVAPQEDTQPNELLRKDRRNNAPPVIQLSKRGRTRKQTGRGRGVNNVPRTAPNKLPRSSQSSQQAQTDSPSFGTSASVSESAPTLGMDNSPQLPHMQPSSSPSHVHSILPTPVARPPSSSGGPVRPKRMSSPTKASAVVGAPNLADIIVATATSNLRRVSSHIKAPNSFSPSPSKRRKISVESPMQGPPSSGQEKSPSTAKGIKRERSLSPGSLPGSKLVTKGALRLSPLPQNCQPSHEDYEANRKVWRAIECANLRKKGLTVLRVLIRTDGMVIDWESKIPVMSDTLLPSPFSSGESSLDAPAGTQNQRFSPPDPTVEPKVEPKEPTHIHPRPGSQRIFAPIEGATRPRHSLPLPRRSLSQSIIKPPPSSPSSSQISASQSQILPSLLGHTPSPRPSHVLPTPPPSTREGTVSESPATETSPSALLALKNTTAKAEPNPEKELEIGSTSTSELTIFGLKPNTTSGGDSCSESEVNAQLETEELLGSSSSEICIRNKELEEKALEFLRVWFASFDSDRSELSSAYATNAIFSLRQLDSDNESSSEFPSMINSTPELKQGCMEILESLLELPDELKVCPSANQEITFDLAMYENHGIGPDVLVICYPFVKDKFMGGSEGYGKGKQKAMVADQWSCEQRFILRPREIPNDKWPLIAVSHQMTIRRVV